MIYARRTDFNHGEIKAAFERMGFSVLDLFRVGAGCPDIAVSIHGLTEFVEIKTEDGELEPEQIRWHRESKATTHVARTLDDVIRITAAMKKRALSKPQTGERT